MTLDDLLDGLARDLNDAEQGHAFTTWAKQDLLRWFNEAQCLIFSLRQNLFTQKKVVKLNPGADQCVCECATIHQIYGQSDAAGNLIEDSPLPRKSETVAWRWTKKPCRKSTAGGTQFRLQGYTFDPEEGGHFMVSPPVPPGEDVYIKIACAVAPEEYSLGKPNTPIKDCTITVAARQWVLFRAMFVDDESQSAFHAALEHKKTFYELLNLQVARERAYQIQDTKGTAV